MRCLSLGHKVVAMVVAGAALAAIPVTSADAAAMRLGLNSAPLAAETVASKEFARLVEQYSKGALKVEVFEGDKLGKPEAQIENLQLGTQDFHGDVSDWLQKLDKDWATLAMPFLFSGIDHVKKFQATPEYAKMKENVIKNNGVRIIADNWYRLPKVLITTKPIFKPADLQGVKLRMPNLATYIDTWSAFGARPTPLAWNEAYLAMKTGTVEGMDSPINLLYPQKFYQAAPYVLMTDHLVAPWVVLMSEKVWQKLTPDQQKVMTQAGKEAGDFYTAKVETEFTAQKQTMAAEGTYFIEAGMKPFADKAQEVMKRFEAKGEWSAGLVEKIRSLVK